MPRVCFDDIENWRMEMFVVVDRRCKHGVIEVSDEFIERYKRIMEESELLQDELRAISYAADHKTEPSI